MSERVELLDHGYLSLVETWGSDESIIAAARMSTGKGFLGWGPLVTMVRQCTACMIIEDEPFAKDVCLENKDGAHSWGTPMVRREKSGDEKLLRYLWTNKHATPFEMAGATFEVQAPIMVFREWHRHRTQSYNEMSARYMPLPDVNYIPSLERLMIGSDGKNKQAGTINDAAILTENAAQRFRMELEDIYQQQERLYQSALKSGVPKELARVHLPVGRYSRMRASANLRNWLAFLALRMPANAQWEIRQYAHSLCGILQQHFPRTMELFLENRPE